MGPVHAAAVVRDGTCALLCASSGGGKSTLTAGLLRHGWSSLGDDKLLLRADGGHPEVAALLQTFNLHPQTRHWLPEVGNLEALPRYSRWTEKRKVRAESIRSGAIATAARPTHLVRLHRRDEPVGVRVTSLPAADVFSCLLRQIVVPNHGRVARQVLSTVALTASGLNGLRVEIGADAYADPLVLETLSRALL